MKKRIKRDATFKAKVALEAVMNDRTVNEIAAKYQIHPCQVSQWKRELLRGASSAFEQGKKMAAEGAHYEEVSALHQKIGQLSVEVDWLKKKLNH